MAANLQYFYKETHGLCGSHVSKPLPAAQTIKYFSKGELNTIHGNA